MGGTCARRLSACGRLRWMCAAGYGRGGSWMKSNCGRLLRKSVSVGPSPQPSPRIRGEGANARACLVGAGEFGALEGAEDDVFVAHAGFGSGFGAVLTEAYAVAQAVAFVEADDVGFVAGFD